MKYSSWRKHSQWGIPVVSSDDLQKCIEKTSNYLSPLEEFVVKDSSGKIVHEQCRRRLVKIVSVELKPLSSNHYHTEIDVTVEDASENRYKIGVDVHGYFPAPSQRELDNGWDIEYGMDHVETEAEYRLALLIKEALEGLK